MSTRSATITLAPATMMLRIEGTTVPCDSWDHALRVMTQQAQIQDRPVAFSIRDTDGHTYTTLGLSTDGNLADPEGLTTNNAATADVELAGWTLSSEDRVLATFKTASAAYDRLRLVADAVGASIPVSIYGTTPTGPITEDFTPSAVPDGTPAQQHQQITAEDLESQLNQTPTPEATNPEKNLDTPEEQTLDSAPEAAAAQPEETPSTSEDSLQTLLIGPETHHESADLDEASEDPAPRRYRAGIFIGTTAALLILAGGLVAVAANLLPNQSTSPEANSAPSQWGQRISTGTTPAMNLDRSLIAAATEEGFTFIDTATGQTKASIPAEVTDATIYPHQTNGFYITTAHTTQTCAPEEQTITCHDLEEAPGQLIHRAGTIAAEEDTNDGPETIHALTGDGFEKFSHPEEKTAYISQHHDQALWASAKDGGTIIHATSNGAETHRVQLANPGNNRKLLSWIGPTSTGDIAILWSHHNGHDTLALHDPDTGEITSQTDVPTGGAGHTRITDTGSAIWTKTAITTTKDMTTHEINTEGAPTPLADGFALEDETLTPTGTRWPSTDGQVITELTPQTVLILQDGTLKTSQTTR